MTRYSTERFLVLRDGVQLANVRGDHSEAEHVAAALNFYELQHQGPLPEIEPAPPEAEPVAEPSARARRYSVRFTRLSINSDAYRMNILADSEEHAEARFNAWAKGQIELTSEEEESEHHCKDYGIVDGHGDPELEGGCETYLEDEEEEDEEAAA